MKTIIAYDKHDRRIPVTGRGRTAIDRKLGKLGLIPMGKIIGYKKVYGLDRWGGVDYNNKVIVKLEIPAHARRVRNLSAALNCNTKYRAEFAIVISGAGYSWNLEGGGRLLYYPGLKMVPDRYDHSPHVNCAGGIHFFLSRKAAENFSI